MMCMLCIDQVYTVSITSSFPSTEIATDSRCMLNDLTPRAVFDENKLDMAAIIRITIIIRCEIYVVISTRDCAKLKL